MAFNEIDDALAIANFIAWQPDKAMWGGYCKEEVWAALCRIIGVDSDTMKAITGTAVSPMED